MIFTDSSLVCPRGTPGASPLVIDIGPILVSERRQDEVASVTKFKSPELLSEFNRSWRELHDIVVGLGCELTKAEKHLLDRRSVMLLEVVPDLLRDRKLVNNEDHREAVIHLDEEMQQLQETFDQIEAVVEWLKGKMKFFENAYNSVKKIMGDDSYNMSGTPNRNLSGDATPTRPVPQIKPVTSGGWGKAKY